MQIILYIIPPLLLVASSLHAQDALGTGNALDNNLSTSGRVNPRSTLPRGTTNSEMRSNSVLSGRNFNEGIGLGTLTQMQLISDVADVGSGLLEDTMNNSPWYWDNWNNQSAQFLSQGETSYFNPHFVDRWAQSPMNMRIGQSMQSLAHTWSKKDTTRDESATLHYPDSWSQRQVAQYQLSQASGSTYNPLQNKWTSTPVGSIKSGGRVGYVTASPLRGISIEANNPIVALGLSTWDAARAQEDNENGIGPSTLVNHWATNTSLIDHRVSENQQSAPIHDLIIDIVRDRARDQLMSQPTLAQQPTGWLDQQYGLLQGQLAGAIVFDEEKDGYVQPESDGEPIEDLSNEIAIILQHGQQIEQLASKDQTRFNELVTIAQENIVKGEYFWAERRFDRALRFTPGHPLATAGLGHARIGAGLYLSASLILESLLSLQPEMIDVTYAPSLLPPRVELVKTAVKITSRLDEERDGGSYAFLLAYIGHQLADREMIERGLAVFEEREGSNDPLVKLLKRIWL